MKILCVESSLTDYLLIANVIHHNFMGSEIFRIESRQEFLDQIVSTHFDFILCDYSLPGFSAKEALFILNGIQSSIPVLVLSGPVGEEAVIEILNNGAEDVILKSNLRRLPLALLRIQREKNAILEITCKEQEKIRAVAAREEMLAIVSHDLRNPLAVIQLNAELILNQIQDVEQVQEKALAIIRSSVRMKSLISDVLDQVRLDSGTFELNRKYKNLQRFLEEFTAIFASIAQDKGISLSTSFENIDYECLLDFERVDQILSNLLGNALKFTAFGGSVLVRCQLMDGKVIFAVKDTGCGIPAESREHIFERSWQNKKTVQHGVGLGLFVAKSLVEKHRGHIELQSEVGVGSEFLFSLPTEVRRPRDMQIQRPHAVRAVIVEDDEDLNEVLMGTLTQMNFEVKSFANGSSALAEVESSHSMADIYLLDYRLPDMNGEKIAEHIFRKNQKACVVFFSAETNIDLIVKKFPNTHFMSKPIRLKELQHTLQGLSSGETQASSAVH